MAKFNSSRAAVATKAAAPNTVNRASAPAYKASDDLAVASFLLTSLLNDQYYRSGKNGLTEFKQMIASHPDPKFLAKAAVYARREFGMRSVTHVLTAELIGRLAGEKNSNANSWVKEFVNRVILRPDDATEIVSYYKNNVGTSKTLPAQLKKGIASRLREYRPEALAKYKMAGRGLSMVDVVNLTHPGRTEAINSLMTGTLESADTWEVGISAAGNDDEKKKEEWVRLVREGKLGHFALLRNLRNIVKNVDVDTRKLALEQLVDPVEIKNSLVFPFRYLTAYKQFMGEPGAGDVLTALDIAANISLSNVPTFSGKTLVAVDCSGSMGMLINGRNNYSRNSTQVSAFETAAMLGIVLARQGGDMLLFDGTAKHVTVPGTAYPLSFIRQLENRGGATNFHAVFTAATIAYDRIIILSDMQGWVANEYGNNLPMKTSFAQYKTRTGANPMLYSFDLAGYGTLMFPEDKVMTVAGFSEKIFDVMSAIESSGGLKSVVDVIRNYDAF